MMICWQAFILPGNCQMEAWQFGDATMKNSYRKLGKRVLYTVASVWWEGWLCWVAVPGQSSGGTEGWVQITGGGHWRAKFILWVAKTHVARGKHSEIGDQPLFGISPVAQLFPELVELATVVAVMVEGVPTKVLLDPGSKVTTINEALCRQQLPEVLVEPMSKILHVFSAAGNLWQGVWACTDENNLGGDFSWMCVCLGVHVFMYMCMCVHMHVHMYVCWFLII